MSFSVHNQPNYNAVSNSDLHRNYKVNTMFDQMAKRHRGGALQFQDLLSPTPLMNIEIVSRFIAGKRSFVYSACYFVNLLSR